MKCPTTASALILVSLASSALEACAAPVSIFDQNIPSIPSTPSTPNPVSFFSFLPRDEHIKSPHALNIDSSQSIGPEARHLHNEEDSESSPVEPVEEASQQDSTDVNNPSTTSIPHRSSRKSSGRRKPEGEGSLAQNPSKSSRPSKQRFKTTVDDDPQTDTSSKRPKRPVQNSPTSEEVNDVHDPDPAQGTGQSRKSRHRSKLSTKADNGTPTADEAFTEGPSNKASSSAKKKTEKSQKKPKPPPSPPSRKSNTNGYFYTQGLTASFSSASSANAANANAFAVNGGNSAGNVVGMPRPPGM
ncbi:hypothetical protein F5050DRAFT_1807256 [Lentinula boryana]|uniref:Uncharacterized protein n=1 Tax=Lentinula boryana TaxID=40481 RepID=A0ABQ8QER2_9AGAR|nr:hypothetical protein F5050DRAFT_1807256 [Lentinula boryana]